MKITIYNPDSTIFKEVVLLDGSMMTNGIRENHDVTLRFSSEEELAIPEGAYVVFNGETFIAKSKSKMEMSHTRSYTYTIKMNGAPSALSSVRLRNPADGKLSFPYTASAHDHLALIVSNMNRYGGGGWVVGDCIYGGEKFLQYNYISCRDALDSLADIYGTEWEIVGKTISLHKVEYNFDSPLELSYGKGSGLRPGIIRDNVQTPMTRLYTQGGSKNIDASEYGSTILLLPKSVTFKYDGNKFEDEQGFDETKARIYSTDSEGTYIKSHKNEDKDVNEGVIDCTDIYPNKLHTVLEVESGDNPRDIVLDIDEDLDYSQYQIAGEIPTITFQSGELMGKTFEIRRDQGGIIMVSKKYSAQGSFVGWKLTLSGTFESGRWLPDSQSGLVPAVGDTCRIFGVRMPSQYICDNNTKSGASWDMLRRGIMYLFECEDYIYSLKMPVDPIWARANWGSVGSKFVAGGYVRYSNSGWAQGGVIMRIKTIRQDISHPYSIEVSLSNGIVGGGVLKGLSDSISNQAGSISEQQDTQKKLEYNVSSLSGNYVTVDTEQTITAPKTFADDVTFGAAREDGTYSKLLIPSTSGPGIYSLCISTQLVSGEAPTGSGGIDETELWTILGNTGTQQIGAGHLTDALAPYATQSWVQQRGYLTSVGVSDIGGLGEGWASLLGSAPDFYSKSQVYSKSEADSRFVTLATEQTISGKKSFTALLTASAGISSTDADLSGYVSASKLYVPFSGNNKKYSLLISTSPVGGETPTGSGGLDETELWSILTDGAGGERIAKAHLPSDAVYQSALSSYALKTDIPSLDGYATQEWVKGKGYLTSVFLSTISDLHADWDALLKAAPSDYVTRWPSFSEVTSTPTTLAGYGITDAYTKEQVNSELAKYVTLAGEQVVSGAKTFTSALTKFNAVSGTDADFSGYVSASRLYVPHSGNNRKYFISVVTAPVDGETPSDGIGLDEAAMWTALGGSMSNRVIDIEHIPSIPTSKITGLDNALASYATRTWVQQNFLASVPAATSSVLGGIKVGYTEISGDKYYAVRVNSSNQAYVHVPWVNTTYSLSSFGITATAAEINKLDGIGTLLHSGNYTSYTVTKTGGGASGTWPISISGNAATADVSNYLFLNPNNGTHASENEAVPTNGRFAIYDVNTATTAGGNDGYIMAFRWPSGNWATQVFVDVDDTGIMALRHRSNSNVWTDWYRILHSGNYASTLDSRYMQDGANLGGKAYLRYVGINGGKYNFLTNVANSTDPFMVYAPTTAGTSGYVLQSTGGTPKWTSRATLQHELLTAGAGCTSIPANADLNDYTTPGVYYCSYNVTVATWSNSPTYYACSLTVLVAAGLIQILREYGYSSSAREFTRRYYDGTWTSWVQTPRMSDVYTRADADSRYVNVSGDTMTGTLTVPVLNVNSQAYIYESASHATRLTFNWSGGIARIYAINNSGSCYYDLSLGQTPGNSGALYFDASAARWGIGTTSPAYKLDVAGTLRATGQGSFDTIKITSTSGISHLIFSRANYNYITAPSGGYISFNTNGVGTSSAVSDLTIYAHQLFPGTTNAVTFGISTRRWSNVYSVLGNFSGLVTAGSIAVTDKLYIPSPDGNQRYYIKFE